MRKSFDTEFMSKVALEAIRKKRRWQNCHHSTMLRPTINEPENLGLSGIVKLG